MSELANQVSDDQAVIQSHQANVIGGGFFSHAISCRALVKLRKPGKYVVAAGRRIGNGLDRFQYGTNEVFGDAGDQVVVDVPVNSISGRYYECGLYTCENDIPLRFPITRLLVRGFLIVFGLLAISSFFLF